MAIYPGFFKPRNCYKKVYRGKTYYIGKRLAQRGIAPDSKEAQNLAFAEWLSLKRFLDGFGPKPAYRADLSFDEVETERQWQIVRAERAAKKTALKESQSVEVQHA